MKAVIPAAGLGSRFLPYTKAQPKEMIPIVDKPALQFVVEEAVDSGMREILIITGRGKRAIEDHFDANIELENHLARTGQGNALKELKHLIETARIMYVRQPSPRGLGDAVLRARSFAEDETFAILLGDDITLNPPCARVLLEAHSRIGTSVIGLQRVPPEDIVRYGMVTGKEVAPGVIRIESIVEKPPPQEARSSLATIGRYVLSPEIFVCLERTKPGVGGEVQLTDAIRDLLAKEDVHGILYEGRRYDIGDKLGWLLANLELAAQREEFRGKIDEGMRRLIQASKEKS